MKLPQSLLINLPPVEDIDRQNCLQAMKMSLLDISMYYTAQSWAFLGETDFGCLPKLKETTLVILAVLDITFVRVRSANICLLPISYYCGQLYSHFLKIGIRRHTVLKINFYPVQKW